MKDFRPLFDVHTRAVMMAEAHGASPNQWAAEFFQKLFKEAEPIRSS